jgi:hypothetical protein
MRALILIAGAALALSSCGGKNDNGNDQNVGENLTAAAIVSNDVTAIDAVTGDAANMAADVDMNFGNVTETSSNAGSNGPATKPAPKKPASTPVPRAETTTNAATNAASNGE